MSQETQLQALRDELNEIQSQMRRSRRRAAVGFVVLVFALVFTLVYAFVQQVAAARNAEEANRQRIIAEGALVQADRNAEEASRQARIAAQQRTAAEAAFRQTQLELEKCRKGRK